MPPNEWSTGDSIYYITVTEEGEYSVTIQTEEGCESRDTAMMVIVAVPIQVPNAFPPNGDGLNDVFRPVVKKDKLQHYLLTIYNQWGQLIYETTDPLKGWDGANASAGVYAWVISYMDLMDNSSQVKGSVALLR